MNGLQKRRNHPLFSTWTLLTLVVGAGRLSTILEFYSRDESLEGMTQQDI